MHGILNINKPKGITSHDVVYKVRKILRTKKVGHTGTLDPNATGVLPIVIGRATKLSDYIMGADKIYRAELILGKTTNTQDITGELLKSVELKTSEKLNSELGMKNLENAIKSFIGELYQTPPMFSAIKKDGVPLYKLARQNIEIERTHRLVNIKNITIHNVLVDRAIIEVHCSKGTYIRTLCHDIGEKLGFGACMGDLQRIRSGNFTIETAVNLNDELEKHIIPMDFFFNHLQALNLDAKFKKFLENGNNVFYKPLAKDFINQTVNNNNTSEDIFNTETNVRVYCDNKFYGIYYIEENSLTPKVFLST